MKTKIKTPKPDQNKKDTTPKNKSSNLTLQLNVNRKFERFSKDYAQTSPSAHTRNPS